MSFLHIDGDSNRLMAEDPINQDDILLLVDNEIDTRSSGVSAASSMLVLNDGYQD